MKRSRIYLIDYEKNVNQKIYKVNKHNIEVKYEFKRILEKNIKLYYRGNTINFKLNSILFTGYINNIKLKWEKINELTILLKKIGFIDIVITNIIKFDLPIKNYEIIFCNNMKWRKQWISNGQKISISKYRPQ